VGWLLNACDARSSCERTRVQLLGQTSLIQASIRSRSVKWAVISIQRVNAVEDYVGTCRLWNAPATSKCTILNRTCRLWATETRNEHLPYMSWRLEEDTFIFTLHNTTLTLHNYQYTAAFYQHDCYILIILWSALRLSIWLWVALLTLIIVYTKLIGLLLDYLFLAWSPIEPCTGLNVLARPVPFGFLRYTARLVVFLTGPRSLKLQWAKPAWPIAVWVIVARSGPFALSLTKIYI